MTDADRAMVAALIDYRVGLPPEGLDGLIKPITIVMDGNGTFEVRKTDFAFLCQKIGDEVPGLEKTLKEGFVLRIPRLPWELYRQAVVFFRAVTDKHKSEAFLQGWFDTTRGEWSWHVPPQDVSGASVNYTNDRLHREPGVLHILDLHSHDTMAAFFSGIDDKDEKGNVERICGVMGKLNLINHEHKWRVWSGRKFMDLQLEDLFEVPTEPVTASIRGTLSEILGGKLTFDPFHDATYPPAWMVVVDEGRKRKEAPVRGGFQIQGPYTPSQLARYGVGGESWEDDRYWNSFQAEKEILASLLEAEDAETAAELIRFHNENRLTGLDGKAIDFPAKTAKLTKLPPKAAKGAKEKKEGRSIWIMRGGKLLKVQDGVVVEGE